MIASAELAKPPATHIAVAITQIEFNFMFNPPCFEAPSNPWALCECFMNFEACKAQQN
ncbi:protein of unknown function [Stenotrophomonas maltophilia]|nr:protein of unknown function [Stenotrophomonas maltophilia]